MINTICICGAGTMGRGIAQVCASAGFYTFLYELNKTVLENAQPVIENELQQQVDQQTISQADKERTLQNIFFTHDLYQCLADVVIEAVVEKAEVKIALFNQLAEINHSETIFATNTSSLSISSIAEKVMNPQRVIGMHFFNPAPAVKLVELITTSFTNQQIIDMIVSLAIQLGKTAIHSKDAPGFIVNRVTMPFYIEAARLARQGIDFVTIDELIESIGFKTGPFKQTDLIGNEVTDAISNSTYEQLGKPARLRPSHLK